MEHDERRPLLANDANGRRDVATKHSGWTWASMITKVRQSWPLTRVMLVCFLFYASSTSPYSTIIELSRAMACAEYYYRHPELPADGQDGTLTAQYLQHDLCDLDWVEQRSATVMSTIAVFGALSASLAILLIEPRLRRWGKKKILLACFCLSYGNSLPLTLLPLGYPFRPRDAPMAISPIWSMRLLLCSSLTASLLGDTLIGMMCLRLFVTDVATAANKTVGLLGLAQMNMVSLTVAPTLVTWLGSLFPLTSADTVHFLIRFRSSADHAPSSLPHQPIVPLPPNEPVPPPPSLLTNNIAPLFVTAAITTTGIVVASLVLPNNRNRDQEEIGKTNGRTTNAASALPREPFYWRIYPRKDIDGQRDWRMLKMVLVCVAHMSSAYAVNILLQYLGHAYRLDQEQVAMAISAQGVFRLVTLLFITPALIAYLQRRTPKPALLQPLTDKQLDDIAKSAPADAAPLESVSEIPIDNDAPRYGATVDQDDVDEGSNAFSPMERQQLRGGIVTWRAIVDRALLRISWGFDIVGWALCALFTNVHSLSLTIASTAAVSLGAPAYSIRNAVDLVIVSDVLARTAESPGQTYEETCQLDATTGSSSAFDPDASGWASMQVRSHAHPAIQARSDEVYFALMGFVESLTLFLSPMALTSIYNRTLTTFPAANWLVTVVLFVIAYTLHFSMKVHHRSPMAMDPHAA